MELERYLLNLWVERECKRALKVSFSRSGTTVDGRGASNPTGSKIKALSCQKYLFISLQTHSPNYMKQSANKKKTGEFGRHYSEIFPTKLTIQSVCTHLEKQQPNLLTCFVYLLH